VTLVLFTKRVPLDYMQTGNYVAYIACNTGYINSKKYDLLDSDIIVYEFKNSVHY